MQKIKINFCTYNVDETGITSLQQTRIELTRQAILLNGKGFYAAGI